MSVIDVGRNWQTSPILDIQTSPSVACPAGYEPLIDREWPGTEHGCYCPYDLGTGLYSSSCSSKQRDRLCYGISSRGEKILSKFNGFTLCVLRLQDKSFVNLKMADAGFCPHGTKKCGGTSDDLSNTVCFPDSEKCPITEITIENGSNVEKEGAESRDLGG